MLPVLTVGVLCTSCADRPVTGQFGTYPEKTLELRLPGREPIRVYRVKKWTFEDGAPDALQLEFESPSGTTDSNAVSRLAIQIWPYFVPYVEHLELSSAILTATTARWGLRGWTLAHFGLIADKDSLGAWRFAGEETALPDRDPSGRPHLFAANGVPLLFGAPLVSPEQRVPAG